MIKDFLNRKKIVAFAEELVAKYFNESELKKIEQSTPSKAEKRARKLTSQIKREAADFSHLESLGIYGKAKLAKVVQSELQTKNIDADIISFVVNSIVRG